LRPAWWQRGVFYQIYPRSYGDTSGDGIGDLRGIREHIDYLDWLGIDAIWLSPIYPSEDVDLGYDISDYCAIDPRFGTLSDFDRLVDDLHDRGIRLVLDLVPNHTSDRHPWFAQSRSSPDDPRHDWYVWRDAAPDGSAPNNWRSYFGGPAWEYLEPPGRWYLHSFHKGQPDLNWDNPEVGKAIQEVMRFWLRRGVDGFRVDVLWLLGKDPAFKDNPTNPGWHDGLPEWLRFRRVYSEGQPASHERARFLRAVVEEFPDRVMIGEVVLSPERAVAYYGGDLDEAHFPHNFALTELRAWTADEVRPAVEEYEGLLPPGAWPNWLLGDHDFPRIASRVGPDRTRLVQMLLLTLRGTPTCYYGDELGLPSADFGSSDMTVVDPQGAGGPSWNRLVARTPMQWSTAPYGGFSHVQPWLPLASEDPELTVERQRADIRSVLHLVRSLIRLRKELPALAVGSYTSIPSSPDVFSFERRHPDGAVEVHLNFGDDPREVSLRAPRTMLLSTLGGRHSATGESDRLTLQAREGVILGAGNRRGLSPGPCG
jgi:alpha-glucosidase